MSATINEQVQEYIERLKSSLLSLINECDKWLECLEKMAKLLNTDVNIEQYRKGIKTIEDKIQDVYDEIVAYEDVIDEALAKSLLGKIMDFENIFGELVVQSNNVGDSIKNIANGLLPEYTKLNLPTSWRELKTTFGKGSSIF